MAGLYKRNLIQNCTCIKDICTETIIFVTSMPFPVLVLRHCAWSQANQQKIQKLEETWCMKITSNRTFLVRDCAIIIKRGAEKLEGVGGALHKIAAKIGGAQSEITHLTEGGGA